MIDTFVTAARRGDAPAALAAVSAQDAAFSARAAVWAGNLHRITWSHLSWKAGAVGAVRPEPTRRPLVGDAWVQPVTVTWSLPGESRVASDELWLTFVDEAVPDGTITRLAGDGDSPVDLAPVPIWLQQPVRLLRAGDVLLLSAAADAETWTTQAADARRAVTSRIGVARRDRDEVLIVEMPQSQQVFEQTLGVPPGSYASVAAAAWPRGPDPTTAPVHVVVNPEASRQLGELGRQVLLTHEAVHVFTRSAQSPAPTWLVEGYADEIAYDAYPAGAAPAEKAVTSAIRADGSDRSWPSDKDFAPDAADLDLAYDLAWTAAHSLAGEDGAATLNRFYAAVDRGGSIGEAAEEIGSSEPALLQRWRRHLTTLAAR
ncbi:MAG TPA: hypothetical protein VFU98_07795 [Microlunatus sp.]|nr:hypothetical protein [Microlunatus sp.]